MSLPSRMRLDRENRRRSGCWPAALEEPTDCLLGAHPHSELAAAAPAAADQGLTASWGLHSGAKPVLVHALPIPRPIRRLHTWSPLPERGPKGRYRAGKGIRL